MEPILYNVRLDVTKPGSQAAIHVRQGDFKSRKAAFFLVKEAEPIEISESFGAVFSAMKPDGKLVFADAEIRGGCVEMLLPEDVMQIAGRVRCDITVYDSDSAVWSPKFDVFVEEESQWVRAAESTENFEALAKAMTEAHAYKTRWANPIAYASEGEEPSAKVSFDEGRVRFDFVLRSGTGVRVLGTYSSIDALEEAVKNPQQGDFYNIGTSAPYAVYMYDHGAWVYQGTFQGEKGDDGKPGEKGEKGDPGTGLKILGTYASTSQLSSSVTSPDQGDMYNVGTSAPYAIYMWDDRQGWTDLGYLQGAQGEPGKDGDPGNDGEPGPAGPNEITGETRVSFGGIVKGLSGFAAPAVKGEDYLAPITRKTFSGSAPTLSLEDRTDYEGLSTLTSLTLTYPSGHFESWVTFLAASGFTLNLPAGTRLIGEMPEFKNGRLCEISVKDSVAVVCEAVEV